MGDADGSAWNSTRSVSHWDHVHARQSEPGAAFEQDDGRCMKFTDTVDTGAIDPDSEVEDQRLQGVQA